MVRLSAVRDERCGPRTLRHISIIGRIGPIRDRPSVLFRLCAGASPHQTPTTKHLLPLKWPMDQPSFQQPKNEADDRVDEELIEIYKKRRG